MLKEMLQNLRRTAPRVHCITNYVTANDCANILLACGASPIMADDPGEAAEITSACDALTLNLGTLHQGTIPAMLSAGKRANALGHPVVLDPVGAGASALRTRTAWELLEQIQFQAIRGNLSEIRALALGRSHTSGVDAGDAVSEGTLSQTIDFAKAFAKETGAVVIITGSVDLVADEEHAFCIRNGHPDMRRVTGTGCQLSAMTAACLAANPTTPLSAAAAAVCAMGLAGETARARMTALDGNASYRNYIIDAVYRMNPEQLEEGAKYEIW